MNRLPLFLVAILLTPFISSVRADSFYRETFNFCDFKSQRPSASAVAGWKALTAGHPEGKSSVLKIQPVGAASKSLPINSNPEGPEDGNAFWAKTSVGLLLYTSEISFEISDLTAVAWRQRIDRESKAFPQYGARLAFLIGGQWYISDYSAMQRIRGQFERVELAPQGLTYGTVADTPGIGPVAPKNSGVVLPSTGTVAAFGLFLQRSYKKVRIDDFTLINNAPAGTYAADDVLKRCSLVVSNPTNVVPGQTSSQTPDQTPGQNITTSDPSVAGGVCAADENPTRVRMNSRTRSRILRAASGRALVEVRSKLILSLASMGLPLNTLTHVTPKDLIKKNRRYYLTLSNGQQVRISNSLARTVSSYVKKAGLQSVPNDPLFQQIDVSGLGVNGKALCVSDFVAMVMAYAQKAKVANRVTFY